MLKGTLQRKRLSSQHEDEVAEVAFNGLFCPQEPRFQTRFDEGPENWNHQNLVNFQGDFTGQVKDPGLMQTLEGTTNLVIDGFTNQTHQIHGGTASGEPSQIESSAAASVISSGLDLYEGPSNSNQTLCESSWKQVGVSKSSEST